MHDLPVILVIDDQWGRATDPMIPDHYGKLPFQWRFATAAIANDKYSAAEALAAAKAASPAVILLDIMFGHQTRLGVEILELIRGVFPVTPIIMFTNLESTENRELVIECMALGANEYLEKAPAAAQMQKVLNVYSDPISDRALYGNSAPIRSLRADIARVAFSGTPSILIYGESGTGKELVTTALHRQGSRSEGPFIAKNCAHSDSQLLESELFGHVRGAFTGAVADRKGLIEEAHSGVLFLDEVADIPLELQAKLLRVLETRTFRRLGRNAEQTSDFQLICATNQNPQGLERGGRLRSDFYYRIAALTLKAPPLRDHRDDIPILAGLFLERFKTRGGAGYPGERFSSPGMHALCRYRWPGNIRELRNVVERAVILSRNIEISVDQLESPSANGSGATRNAADLESASNWPKARVVGELRMCIEAKRQICEYKGDQWRAEFMRLMYPECKAANAKGFADLIKRLTQGPWGIPGWRDDEELKALFEELAS